MGSRALSGNPTGRRRVGTRRQEQLYRDFDAWGYDFKDWTRSTRRTYLGRVKDCDSFLQRRGASVFWATLRNLQGYLFTIPEARTRNNARQALVGWGDFLVYKEIRPDNPAKDLPRLKEPKNLPKPVQMDEANRVLRAARALGQETYIMLLVLFYTALRRGNVVELQWADISYDWKWITVIQKGRKPHEVPIHPFLRLKLQAWKNVSQDPQWVFPSPRFPGRHVSAGTLYHRVREVGELAGVANFHPHICRHTAATRAYERTNDIYAVNKFLGHASMASTQIYTEVRNPKLEQTVEQLDFLE